MHVLMPLQKSRLYNINLSSVSHLLLLCFLQNQEMGNSLQFTQLQDGSHILPGSLNYCPA